MILYWGWGGGVAGREECSPRSPTWMAEGMVFSPNKIESKRGRAGVGGG